MWNTSPSLTYKHPTLVSPSKKASGSTPVKDPDTPVHRSSKHHSSTSSTSVDLLGLTTALDPITYVHTPTSHKILRCTVIRERPGLLNLYPKYFLYRESDKQLLCVARKRKKTASLSLLFSTDPNELTRCSPSVAGILDSQLCFKTNSRESRLFDHCDQSIRRPIISISFSGSLKTTKRPRFVAACIHDQESGQDLVLSQKEPVYDESSEAYVLNFGGRVCMASQKNFQLTCGSNEEIVLQFGKTGEDSFILDFRSPLSPLMAFAIACSSFH
ncbi:hypothetical protein P9112_002717 [Eukaryota sp. TZLM1-RC]